MTVSASLIAKLVALQKQTAAAYPLQSAPYATLKAIQLNSEQLESDVTAALYAASGQLDNPLVFVQSNSSSLRTVQQVFTAVGNGVWIVPLGVTAITAEGIGGGGSGGSATTSSSYTGGSGAAYAMSLNLPVAPGQSIYYSVGAGGTPTLAGAGPGNNGIDTWLNINANTPPISAAGGIVADNGYGGDAVNVAGGLLVNCVGTTSFAGGGTIASGAGNTGGGGAAGPTGGGQGAGVATGGFFGGSGGGGAANSNSTSGAFTTGNNGSAGGAGPLGTGGGVGGIGSVGGNAIIGDGGGGGGGSGATGTTPYAGGNGSTYYTPSWPVGYGPGGGGGASGSGGNIATPASANGGLAGLYGGGGGGTGIIGPGGIGGAGGQGIIIVTYTVQNLVSIAVQDAPSIVAGFQGIVGNAFDQWRLLDMLSVISRANLNVSILLGTSPPMPGVNLHIP